MSLKSLAGFTGLFGVVAVVLAVVCSSCSNPASVKSPDQSAPVVAARHVLRPGAFGLAYDPGVGLEKRLAKSEAGTIATISLDTINKSKNFLFILKNTGESPIIGCHISIATGDSLTGHYNVTPSSIAALKSDFDTSGADSITNSLVPIVVLSMDHGWAINGTNWAGLLKPGYNTSQLSVYGVTRVYRDTSDTIGHLDTISAKVNLRVWANESDFKVIGLVDSTRIDTIQKAPLVLDTQSTAGTNWLSITKDLNMFECRYFDRIKIINIGNVTNQAVTAKNPVIPVFDTLVFHPGDTLTFTKKDSLENCTNCGFPNFNILSKCITNRINLPPQQSDGSIGFLFLCTSY
jgi:hypothetical protein